MEDKIFIFESPIPPSVNGYLEKSIRKAGYGYRTIGFNKSEKALIYENDMRNILHKLKKRTGWETPSVDKFYKIELTYFFDVGGKDPDNTLKMLLDSLVKNKIIATDAKIMVVMKDILIDSNNPRIEAKLTVLDKVGVFKDKETHDRFIEENCKKCKKYYYKKVCGNYTKYLDNKITEHLDFKNMVCKNIKVKEANNELLGLERRKKKKPVKKDA